jgi:hypothetical protein
MGRAKMIDVPLPAYLADITDETERKAVTAQFQLRLAALYFSPKGTLTALAKTCGYHEKALSAFNNISPETAILLEKALGRELFPREFFRPDLFLIQR